MLSETACSDSEPDSQFPTNMDALDYWRLCDELNIYQFALLVIGQDPVDFDYIRQLTIDQRPRGYEAAKTALRSAIQSQKVPATLVDGELVELPNGDRHFETDWWETRIEVDEIRKWLLSRGMTTGFFFPDDKLTAEYLDPTHHHYAPKLAAAIHAWEAVNADPNSIKKKTPKKALEAWLRAHANAYGLTKEDGNPNDTGNQEISKIANWDTRGGAPKTNG